MLTPPLQFKLVKTSLVISFYRSEEEFVVIQFGDRERLLSEPNINNAKSDLNRFETAADKCNNSYDVTLIN